MKKPLLNTLLALTLSACSSQAVISPNITVEPTMTTKVIEESNEELVSQDSIDIIVEGSQKIEVANFITREERARMATLPDQFPEYRDFPKSIYGEFKPEDFKAINYLDSQGGELHNLPLNYPFKLVFSWQGYNYSIEDLVNSGEIEIHIQDEYFSRFNLSEYSVNEDDKGMFSFSPNIWFNLPDSDIRTVRLQLNLDGESESIEYTYSTNFISKDGILLERKDKFFEGFISPGIGYLDIQTQEELDLANAIFDSWLTFCPFDLVKKSVPDCEPQLIPENRIDYFTNFLDEPRGYGGYWLTVASPVGEIIVNEYKGFVGDGYFGGPAGMSNLKSYLERWEDMDLSDIGMSLEYDEDLVKAVPNQALIDVLDEQGYVMAGYLENGEYRTIIAPVDTFIKSDDLVWIALGRGGGTEFGYLASVRFQDYVPETSYPFWNSRQEYDVDGKGNYLLIFPEN